MTSPLRLGLIAIVLGAVAPAAFAHHALTMYDRQAQRPLEGVVREFQWVNPHTWLQLMVLEKGKAVTYNIEGGSPNALSARGWKSTVFQPGDKVTVTVSPLKSGEPGGLFVSAVLPDGTVLTRRQPVP